MANILAIGSGGGLEEVADSVATKAIALDASGALQEIIATGTQKVIALDASGKLQEISVTFGIAAPTVNQFRVIHRRFSDMSRNPIKRSIILGIR